MWHLPIRHALSYPFGNGSYKQRFSKHLKLVQHRHPAVEGLHSVSRVGVGSFAGKKIQVQSLQQLARGHTAGTWPARSRISSDFVSSAFRPSPGKSPRWSGVSDAVGPLASRDLPPLYSSSLQPHGGWDNLFRVSGASAWFLGSQRGTLGWEIRPPPRYYK